VQVREQRSQLKKRAESVAKIRDAQESLDQRIGELEGALEDVQSKLEQLKRLSERARQLSDRAAPDGTQPSGVRIDLAEGLPAYLRVEI
jgi:predicted RNase H-like nuclease (RuvC/YqgF family)